MNVSLIAAIIGDIVLLIGGFFVVLRPVLHGAPWVVTKDDALLSMMQLANIQPGMKVVDLGSGDGKIVIALAKMGIEANGYEINPLLVRLSQQKIKKEGLEKNAFVHLSSFWKEDLSRFDVIIVYGIKHIMGDLEEKIKREAKPGTKIISNVFAFPTLKPVSKESLVYLYIM